MTHQMQGVARGMWVAFVSSIFMYGFILRLAANAGGAAPAGEAADALRWVFIALSAAGVGVTFARGIWEKVLPNFGAGTPGVGPDNKVFVLYTIFFALCEMPAMFGLVLGFITRDPAPFYPLAALSLLAFALHFPGRTAWEDWKTKAV